VQNNGNYNVFEQGAAAEIRTGMDPNGSSPDIAIVFNPEYLTDELWFDPDPHARTAAVPIDRIDAVSVFLHEFGHAFAFNGWRDLVAGTLPGDYESTFDEQTIFDGTNFFFVGSQASALHGAPVPLTYANIFHVGNNPPRPGNDLVPDLMNGVFYYRGSRYTISQLDVAILADAGVPVAPPNMGDSDCDGDVDFDDIDDFVLGLNNAAAYEDLYGVPPSLKGDTDGDSDLDFDDIAGFVTVLSGSSAPNIQPIPEPSIWMILAGFLPLIGRGFPGIPPR
jgi:hypothetical protein